jgi:selenocysteine-specific elongation factor
MAQLAAAAAPEPETALAGLLALEPQMAALDPFLRDRALGPDVGDRLVSELGLAVLAAQGRPVLTRARLAELQALAEARLAAFHAEHPDLPGMGLERLRLELAPKLAGPLFRAAVQELARGEAMALDGAWARLPGHAARLSPPQEAVWQAARPHLLGPGRFRPPRVRDLVPVLGVTEPELRRILKLVARMGEAYEVAPDHFFPRAVLAEVAETLLDLSRRAPDGTFSAADLRDRLDNGRKVAIQLLEFFDRQGVTLRRGDLRRLDERRLDLFLPLKA